MKTRDIAVASLTATALFLATALTAAPAHAAAPAACQSAVPHAAADTNVCDEAKLVIKRLVASAQDPTKVTELKSLLSTLCRETDNAEECMLLVSKLDLFLAKLLPYLGDSEQVARMLGLCRS